MALTRTEREREARAGREVLMSVDFTGAATLQWIGDATAGREERRAAAEDEEAAATRDCWASPRMTQSGEGECEKEEPRGGGEEGERGRRKRRVIVGEVR
jgi:hypothetical protein